MNNYSAAHNFTSGALANRGPILMRDRVLSRETLQRRAPSVFAEGAHESRSARYTYIPTIRVVDALAKEGFMPVDVRQSRSRAAGRAEHTKHMVTFARADGVLARVGDSIPQVCLVNSHDGSSSYRLYAGMHRLACSNGLIVGGGDLGSLSVPHTGDIVSRVIEGSYTVVEEAAHAGDVAADWRSVALSAPEAEAFAGAALKLRWDGAAPVSSDQVQRVLRAEDQGTDLWTTFNRVQEGLVRGGQRVRTAAGRRQTVRAITGIDGNVALNRALWDLAERMAELKRAA